MRSLSPRSFASPLARSLRGARYAVAIRGVLAALAAASSLVICEGSGRAHEPVVVPPTPKTPHVAAWPGGRIEAHDVLVPLLLTVDPDGHVSAVEIEAGIGPEFDAAAIRAASSWSFEPAKRDGKPVRARIRAVARFSAASSSAPPSLPPAAPMTPLSPTSTPAIASPPRAGITPPASSAAPGKSAPAAPLVVQVVGEGPPRSASESVKRRDVIAAAPHRTASDLLLVVPGVFITQHSGQGKAHQIFLRGFDAVHGQDVELTVGGAPVNEVSNVHGQGYADLHFVMPEVVKQIRAKPGAYDPRQGDFAVAGSIAFDLGYAEPGVTASGTLGMFGERRLFLAYHPVNAPDETFAAFETQSTDGFGPARSARRTSAIAQAVFPLGGYATARVMASTYAARFDSAGVVRLRDVEAGAIDRFDTYDPKQGGDSSRHQVVLEVRHEDDDARWSIAPFFIARGLRLRADYTGYLQDPTNGDSDQQINDSFTLGATAFYRRRVKLLSPEDAIEGGVFARNDWIEQSQRRLSRVDDRVIRELVDAKVRATDVAGWIDAAVRPIQRVVVRGGLRVDGLSYAVEERLLAGSKEGAGAARGGIL